MASAPVERIPTTQELVFSGLVILLLTIPVPMAKISIDNFKGDGDPLEGEPRPVLSTLLPSRYVVHGDVSRFFSW